MKHFYLVLFCVIFILTGCENNQTTEREYTLSDMILIEAGSFVMGNLGTDSNCCPAHEVFLGAFYISSQEISQKEYLEIMGSLPEICQKHNDNYPVYGLSWLDAITYCNLRSEHEGLEPCYSLADSTCDWTATGYRLPTEAEWEYAATGGGCQCDSIFSGCNDADQVAWYLLNSANSPRVCGSKQANSAGLFDMSGNVYEWCWDWYSPDYYCEGISDNPTGPDKDSSYKFKVLRGGAWYEKAEYCCCCKRPVSKPYGTNYAGLRVVRNAD